MKKGIFIAVLGMATAVAAFGQGQIIFNNYVSSTQPTGVIYGNGPLAGELAGSEITGYLYFGASTDTTVTQLALVPGSATPVGAFAPSQSPGAPGTGAGIIEGATISVNSGTPGTFAFAIFASGTYLGVTYTGWSPIFVGATQATSLANVPNLPSGLLNANEIITSVPEPTTMALGGLGLAALVAFRRKQV
jgi:hypothetical protein